MKLDNERYFVACRDTSKGGLHFSKIHPELIGTIMDEIFDKYLEITTVDAEKICIGTAPLANGDMLVYAAKRIDGNSRDRRAHDIIRGVVLGKAEFLAFNDTYIASGEAENIFFDDSFDAENPEAWIFPRLVIDEDKLSHSLESVLDNLGYKNVIGLYSAVIKVKKNRVRVQIVPEKNNEFTLLAILNKIMSEAGIGMFILANGECTLTFPDIIICDRLKYIDSKKYRKTSFEKFFLMANMLKKEISEEELGDSCYKKIDQILKLCSDYLMFDTPIEKVYEIIDRFHEEHKSDYRRLRRALRNMLLEVKEIEYCTERYVRLLFIAFKEERYDFTSELDIGYDIKEISEMINRVSRNRKIRTEIFSDMLEMIFAEKCTDLVTDSAFTKAIKRIAPYL